jgi:glycosyltransferase involved in cell wall biosynthesis
VRIGIDARELTGHPTGVGRYLQGLLTAWATDEAARRHEFVLYTHEPLSLSIDARRFPARTVGGRPGSRWEQVNLPRAAEKDALDVFFSPGYTAPLLLKLPFVVAIHDVSFEAHPEWFRAREGLRRRFLTRQSASHAAGVITISEFSKSELIERLRVPADRVHVIPPGVTAPARPALGSTAPRALFAGSIFNRRRVPDLIRAFAPIAARTSAARLDLVGDNRSYPYQDVSAIIAREGLGAQVHWRRYVTDDELGDLYGHARAFAFLSEYEGLGLTPLEALAAGVPPVLLDTLVARESCGAAALYVPRADLAATTNALERLLFDERTRAEILGAAPAALARYRWPRAAADTLTLLERVARP